MKIIETELFHIPVMITTEKIESPEWEFINTVLDITEDQLRGNIRLTYNRDLLDKDYIEFSFTNRQLEENLYSFYKLW